MSLFVWLKIGAVLALLGLLWVGWVALTDHYEQIGKDSRNKEVATLKAAAVQSKADTDQCVAVTKVQSEAVVKWQQAGMAAKAEAKAAQAKVRQNDTRIASLAAQASATPKRATCEDELTATERIMRDAVEARRQ